MRLNQLALINGMVPDKPEILQLRADTSPKLFFCQLQAAQFQKGRHIRACTKMCLPFWNYEAPASTMSLRSRRRVCAAQFRGAKLKKAPASTMSLRSRRSFTKLEKTSLSETTVAPGTRRKNSVFQVCAACGEVRKER